MLLSKRNLLILSGIAAGALLASSIFAQSSRLLGQAWGLGDHYGVSAVQAQKMMIRKCSHSRVVVAVIDTGVDVHHPDLSRSMWVNPAEVAGNGKDDDKNGFVDDLHGWDFATNSGRIYDKNGHGTHIAGIIAGNGQGPNSFQGVCPGVRIMSVRYYNEQASGVENLRNSIRAVEYAIKNGAHIINYSGGGVEPSPEERKVFELAEKKGILVVAAAGNERSNADQRPYYPAAYGLSNIISVTAIDVSGRVLPSSNWGAHSVHVAAPGNAILSTYPNGGYGFLTGTSQATAFVSGVAAMLMTENPQISYNQVKDIIESSVIKAPQLQGKTRSAGYVSAPRALKALASGNRVLSSFFSSSQSKSAQ